MAAFTKNVRSVTGGQFTKIVKGIGGGGGGASSGDTNSNLWHSSWRYVFQYDSR